MPELFNLPNALAHDKLSLSGDFAPFVYNINATIFLCQTLPYGASHHSSLPLLHLLHSTDPSYPRDIFMSLSHCHSRHVVKGPSLHLSDALFYSWNSLIEQHQWTPKSSPEMARHPHHLRIRVVNRVLYPFLHLYIYFPGLRLCFVYVRPSLGYQGQVQVTPIHGSLVGDVRQHPFH
jgi:hypothetical protein